MLMPSHFLARAEKAGVMIVLIKLPDSETHACELGLKLGGRLRIRARITTVTDGQAEVYRLARILDELSFALSSEQMFSTVLSTLRESPFLPLITSED